MATRRRIGISTATSEAARRQLMQPVPCWERVWVKPEGALPNSTLKVYKWVKTDKKQQFSDDEDEVDAPLAPLPDEPEVVEGDDDVDQDEATQPATVSAPADLPDSVPEREATSKPPTPKPEPIPLSLEATNLASTIPTDDLDDSLKPLDTGLTASKVDVGDDEDDVGSMNDTGDLTMDDLDMTSLPTGGVEDGELDMSQLPPDGTAFEGVQDLSQMEEEDGLLGGPMMDQSEDPFVEESTE
ncbi:hypothetical protein JAAARDRAFT_53577 [Jaapia argillacea MUCL 33604]|uniref:Uncharacterized protein n=1 Tax=Jaapia argillacea MUCL 33604 TaxID=933084 RepID=A0A067Q8H3_9AGAM|nr:hypothetical protein JAAARDRAFT_53577 [Jaapia argillacea MUCL 33604]